MIIVTFMLARDLFGVAPEAALGATDGEALNVNRTVDNLSGILVRILLLVVMGGLGSMIATRGIKLYGASLYSEPEEIEPKKGRRSKSKPAEEPETES